MWKWIDLHVMSPCHVKADYPSPQLICHTHMRDNFNYGFGFSIQSRVQLGVSKAGSQF